VYVRVRPPSERERHEVGDRLCLTTSGDRTVVHSDPARPDVFVKTFDHVFTPDTRQDEVFQVAGVEAVENCLQGFNSSIFAVRMK
jgi:hypothetical protein